MALAPTERAAAGFDKPPPGVCLQGAWPSGSAGRAREVAGEPPLCPRAPRGLRHNIGWGITAVVYHLLRGECCLIQTNKSLLSRRQSQDLAARRTQWLPARHRAEPEWGEGAPSGAVPPSQLPPFGQSDRCRVPWWDHGLTTSGQHSPRPKSQVLFPEGDAASLEVPTLESREPLWCYLLPRRRAGDTPCEFVPA